MKSPPNERYENDPTPSREIVEAYRRAIEEEEDDSDASLSLVHYRGTRVEFDLGAEYAASADPLDRITGANILSNLGGSQFDEDPTFVEESVAVLIPLLKDPDAKVVVNAAMALGRRADPSAVPHLIALENHEDPDVRWALAYSLDSTADDNEAAIAALIRLTKDPDDEVRDWALFSLGSQHGTDTPAIREALFEGLGDSGAEARGEALVGLANRGDPRVEDAIVAELRKGNPTGSTFDAIGITRDPRWLPDLEKLLAKLPARGSDDPFWAELRKTIALCGTDG